MIGIENVNEYYTNHYVAAILGADVRPFLERWKTEGDEQDDQVDEAPTELPWRRLGGLQREFFTFRDRMERRRSPSERVELHRAVAERLLGALGYPSQRQHQPVAGKWVPLLSAWQRANGSPLLWVVPATSAYVEKPEDRGDLLSSTLLAEQHGIDPDPPTDLDAKALEKTTCEDLISAIFGLEEPPRFVLLVGDTEWILADRGKWAEQRLLRFDWAELLGRRDAESLRAVAALLHHDALVPPSGTAFVDTLDESSHRHAYGVSADLKYALRECIERIGNEAIRYRREVSKKKVYGEEIDGQQLAIECVRYMYRLLFLFYVEARPELGYAPIGERSYERGYSLERLRDLETVELERDEDRNGFYIHECLEKLFKMVYEGTEAISGSTMQYESLHNTFQMVPLRSHLFDPARVPFLAKVRLRNCVLLEVIKAMSLSREGGKQKRRGRISYATLGINQLGEVYEALLSFRGFFAEETLFEVKPEGVERPDPIKDVAYFVPEADLKQYKKAERVFDEAGQPRSYEPGTFIYRMAGRDREKSASYYTPEVLTKCLVKYALKELLEDEHGKPKYEKAEDLLALTICEPAMGSAAFLNEAINQLAERYLQARQQELGERIPHDRYLRELQRVRMYMADNNVFGVDLNPVAVELAEVSLWLNAIFTEKTDKGHEVFVPWFGGQLACGNSLVGAWRKVFPARVLGAGKGGDEVAWLDTVPDRVPLGTARPKGSVHHFLLPDRGMATYGEGTEGKPIRERWGKQLATIEAWRKQACRPLEKDDVAALVKLADAVDKLWATHAELLRKIRERTTDPLSVYGHEHALAGKPPSTTEAKDRIWRHEMASEQVRASSPYRRLKLAMDYWCALWFWPIEKADLLPDRDEWLADLAMLLAPGVLPALKGGDDQRELFAPTMPAESAKQLVEDVGFADVERIIARSERLRLADDLACRYHFLHWELEYGDIFSARSGFDLVVGNPPWVRVEWNESDALGDRDPSVVLKKLSAKDAAGRRDGALRIPGTAEGFLAAYEEASGTQAFLSAMQTHPNLRGVKVNLYKAFIFSLGNLLSATGIGGLLHPTGLFDDPAAGAARRALYPTLRRHYQFNNELKLFPIANRARYSANIYSSQHGEVSASCIFNLFHPATIDSSITHDGGGPVPGIKDISGNWDISGHRRRIIHLNMRALTVFARLYDEEGVSSEEAKLAPVHSTEILEIMKRLALYESRLASFEGRFFITFQMNETYAKADGLIDKRTEFPATSQALVLSGPHFFAGNPLSQTPKRVCETHRAYEPIDLQAIPDDYLPRTNFVIPPTSRAEFNARVPQISWSGEPSRAVVDFPRLIANNMIAVWSERTLQPALIPPGPSHIGVVNSHVFEDTEVCLAAAATWSSLPLDFYVKTTGLGHFQPNLARRLPIVSAFANELTSRICALNCLTSHYSKLWRDSFRSAWLTDRWAKAGDPILPQSFYTDLSETWSRHNSLRSHYARRMAMVEIDVLVSMALGISLRDLQTIYRVQFPVMQSYESETWYDQCGRIVFTNSRGLPGVGLARARSAAYPEGPYWEDVMHMSEASRHSGNETVTQVVTDDTLPGGPRQKTIVYQAPWVRCNREHDYEVVWKHFEDRFGKSKSS